MSFFNFGGFGFPDKHIKWETIQIKANQRQDLDSYTDAFGVTQRNALEHTKTEVTFTTLSMKADEMNTIMSGLRSNYINSRERDAQCSYYDPETGSTKSGHFYLDPSLQHKIKEVDHNGTPTLYGEMNWTFIEY